MALYLKIFFKILFKVMFKSKNDAISKSAPNDLKLLHNFDIDKTNVQTKSKSILTIFERFTEIRNFRICRFLQRRFIKTLIFGLESRNL